jgi:hypothetical protein
MPAVVLQVLCAEMTFCQMQFVLRKRMLASAVVSTRLRTTSLKPYVICSFPELIRKAVLPDNAESTPPVSNCVETHKKVNWSLTDVYDLRKGVFRFMRIL